MFQSIFDDRKKGGHYQSFKVVSVLKVCEYSYDSFTKGQFLSHWELAEPVFYSEELSCLPYKSKNLTLSMKVQTVYQYHSSAHCAFHRVRKFLHISGQLDGRCKRKKTMY